MRSHLFLGPTLGAAQASRLLPGVVIHPPIAHGDLLRLHLTSGDLVIIVDGLYHHVAAVRHKEILDVLARGVRVVGCASMGALRAAELDRHGMEGHGWVYRQYADGVLIADDEVAVAHTEAPEYRRLGDPLVSVRHATAAAVAAGRISGHFAGRLIESGRQLHYTARSWRALASVLDTTADLTEFEKLRTFLREEPAAADIKAADTLATLSWLAKQAPAPDRPLAWADEPHWHNWFLTEWRAAWPGPTVSGVPIRTEQVLRYQQLHHPMFPAAWRQTVLRRLIGCPDPVPTDLVDQALAAAAEQGLLDDIDRAGRIWLTAAERTDLPDRERRLRILVRVYRPVSFSDELCRLQPWLVEDTQAQLATAEAITVNDEVRTWGPRHSIHHLRVDALREYLAECWQVTADDESLTAAAQDRGLASLSEAVQAVRAFYLRSHLSKHDLVGAGR